MAAGDEIPGTQWSVLYEQQVTTTLGRRVWTTKREFYDTDETAARHAALVYSGNIDAYRNIKVQTRIVPDWDDAT